jgi:Druantia protein DruA
MEMAVRYRGREFSGREVAEVREIIAAHPDKSRRFLSQEVCRRWNWRQPNGTLKDMVCRGLMLHLARLGHIELPPVRQEPHRLAHSKRPDIIEVDRTPIESGVAVLKRVELRQVSRTPLQKLYNSLIHQYHYLGYTRPVGEHLEYLAFCGSGRVIACIGWCSAPRHIGSRDKHIGWNKEQRQQRLQQVIINIRFLIMPWVRVPHLASHLLGLTARRICRDWREVYRHDVTWLETFVDPERGFKGTCYKAANWRYLGMTTGRGKADQTKRANRSLKYVFGYPLRKDFREALCDGVL